MKKIALVLFLVCYAVYAQPGPMTGTLRFKVYKDGNEVDLSENLWKIEPKNIVLSEKQPIYTYPGFYRIVPVATPMGGLVREDFYLDIIFKKDTMRVFLPVFTYSNVILDSIPFSSGIYKIPSHIYNLIGITNSKYKNYVPKINGDWKLFKSDRYKCYIEKVKDLDLISSENHYSGYNDKWDELRYYKAMLNISFRKNVIIWHYDDADYEIYQVKNVMDTTFLGNKIRDDDFEVKALFIENDDTFGLIQKTYSGITSSVERSYGIYKLHFVSNGLDESFKNELIKKQIEEDYEAAIKFINMKDYDWKEKQLNLVRDKFKKSMKKFDN